MGCNQSREQASDPIPRPRHTNKPTEQPPPTRQLTHKPTDFTLTMVGNAAAHALVLGFSPQAFTPIPCRTPIPRYCHALIHDAKTAFITGGIDDLEANVNNKATLDHQILEGTISKRFVSVDRNRLVQDPQNSFQVMPDMINARYAHTATELAGCLYVIGGRQYGQDENGLLSACQRYDHKARKWKAIPSMQYPRAGASALVYEDFIYVFGGYSGKNTRTRAIETYSEGDSSWRKLPYQMHQGFQGAFVCKKPGVDCSIMIFGGKTNLSKSNRVVEYNLDKSTVSYYPPMKEERSFHKGANIEGQVFLVGGGCEHIEAYSVSDQRSELNQELSYLEYCTMKELNSFSQLNSQLTLTYQKRKQNLPVYTNRILIFGHAFEPFAKAINTDNMVVVSEGQNMAHSFYQFTNVVKVNKQYCFVLGGISSDLTEVTNTVYSFNLLNNQIKPLKPMITPRYAFATTVLGSHLYVMGGRKLGDDNVAIINQCQRFSFQTYTWESIPAMKHKRQSATAVALGEYILCFGGYKGDDTKSNEVEMYVPSQNRWIELERPFDLSVESMTPVVYHNQFFLFGGRADSDIQKVFRLKMDLDEGVKYEKSVKTELEAVGTLSQPGTNLKVFVDQSGKAYVLGNVRHGVDVYDLNTHKPAEPQQLTVFEHLSDPYFQAYTTIF